MPGERTVDQITPKRAGSMLSAADFNAIVEAVSARTRDGAVNGIRYSGGFVAGQAEHPEGFIDNPALILPASNNMTLFATQADNWFIESQTAGCEGVSITLSRVVWNSTAGALVGFERTFTFDSAGKLGSVTAETQYEITPSEECDGTNSYAVTNGTNTFTQPQTFQNGTNSTNVKGGTTASDQSNVAGTGQAHAGYYTGTNNVANINGLGQYSFSGTGDGTGRSAFDFAGADAAVNREATRNDLGGAGTMGITLSVGDPGSDSNLPTEAAVRTAIDAMGTGGGAPTTAGYWLNGTNGELPNAVVPTGANGINVGTDGTVGQTFGTNANQAAEGDHNHTGQYAGTNPATSSTAGLGYAENDTGVSVNAGVYSLDINSLASISTLADDDNFLVFDASGTANKNISFADLKTEIGATAADPWANLTLLTATAGAQLGTSPASVYAAGSSAVVEVWSISLVNTHNTAVAVKLSIFGTNDANLFFPSYSISSGERRELYYKPPRVLGNSDAIYGYAATSGVVNIQMHGIVGTSSSYSLLSSEGQQLGTAAANVVSAGSQTAEMHSIDYINTNATSQAVVTAYHSTTATAGVFHHPAIAANRNARYGEDVPTILGSSQTFMALADIANIVNVMAWGKRRT
ncbi:MAG: hypothetical protein HZA50_11585 [Planctomycetes bacterium]|nr:hypothetical protein [Planctomycetota bacterium]